MGYNLEMRALRQVGKLEEESSLRRLMSYTRLLPSISAALFCRDAFSCPCMPVEALALSALML